MGEPNTGGVLRTKITDMQVGDYILTMHNTVDGSYKVNDTTGGEIPVTGKANANWQGYCYFIKVDKGLLVADRVVTHTISWDALNQFESIQGVARTLDGINGLIRSLGGGNSYADANGNSSTTDAGLGAWPQDNEWDEYIVRKDYGTGAGRDDVWHFSSSSTFCQESPIISINNSGSARVRRGGTVNSTYFSIYESAYTNSSIGFRPVFQYEEVTP